MSKLKRKWLSVIEQEEGAGEEFTGVEGTGEVGRQVEDGEMGLDVFAPVERQSLEGEDGVEVRREEGDLGPGELLEGPDEGLEFDVDPDLEGTVPRDDHQVTVELHTGTIPP